MSLLIKSLNIAFLFYSIVSCSQPMRDKRTRLLEDIKRKGKGEFFNDTASLRLYAEHYGDVILLKIDSFLNDTSKNSNIENFKHAIRRYKIQDSKSQVGWVNDYGNIFSIDEKRELNSIIDQFFRKTVKQIVLVSIDSSIANEKTFDNLIDSIRVGWTPYYAVGGTFVVIGVSADLGKARISFNEELKSKLTSSKANEVINEYLIPDFRNHLYFLGTKKSLMKIVEILQY